MHSITPETCRAVAIAVERTFSGFNTYSRCFAFTGTGTTWRSPEPTQSLNVPPVLPPMRLWLHQSRISTRSSQPLREQSRLYFKLAEGWKASSLSNRFGSL